MSLTPYDDFAPGPLVFPIGGKEYTRPELSADAGVRLSLRLGSLTLELGTGQVDQPMDEAEETSLYQALLGPVYDQLIADSVPFEALKLAGTTAMVDFLQGRAAAEDWWEAGGDPEGFAARQAAPSATRATSTSGGGGSTTRRRASGSGTTSRRTSRTA